MKRQMEKITKSDFTAMLLGFLMLKQMLSVHELAGPLWAWLSALIAGMVVYWINPRQRDFGFWQWVLLSLVFSLIALLIAVVLYFCERHV